MFYSLFGKFAAVPVKIVGAVIIGVVIDGVYNGIKNVIQRMRGKK